MSNSRPLVYVVDDDERVRVALGRIFSLANYEVAFAASAEEFLDIHDPSVYGCAVLDLNLPGKDGLSIQDALASFESERPVIFLTGEGDIPTSVNAMKSGAVDFLTKPADAQQLLRAVETAIALDRERRDKCKQREHFDAAIDGLTPRELQVLELVVQGMLNKQIAFELGTAEKTVKVHRGRMMKKMGVRTVADLVRVVTEHGVEASSPQPG